MTALAPVPVRAIRTSPPPAAAVLGARADAAKAQFEATGYRRAQAPEWLLDVLACLVGLAAFVAVSEHGLQFAEVETVRVGEVVVALTLPTP